jgi:uncharacterized membrane protein YkoI
MKNFLFPPLLAILLLLSPAAQADISQQEAVSIAQRVHPGRVLSVKLVKSSNSLTTSLAPANNSGVYRVKTLSAGGDVHIVVIDASSGKVISK